MLRLEVRKKRFEAEYECREKHLKMDDAMSKINPEELIKLMSNNNTVILCPED